MFFARNVMKNTHACATRGGWNAEGQWIPIAYMDTHQAELLFRHKVFADTEKLLTVRRIPQRIIGTPAHGRSPTRFVVLLKYGAFGSIRCLSRLRRHPRPSRCPHIQPGCAAWVGRRRDCHRLSAFAVMVGIANGYGGQAGPATPSKPLFTSSLNLDGLRKSRPRDPIEVLPRTRRARRRAERASDPALDAVHEITDFGSLVGGRARRQPCAQENDPILRRRPGGKSERASAHVSPRRVGGAEGARRGFERLRLRELGREQQKQGCEPERYRSSCRCHVDHLRARARSPTRWKMERSSGKAPESA